MQNTNMSENNICRLCVTNCQDHRSLFDENGFENEVHQLMVKYFDTKLFNTGLDIKLNIVCLECWRHIFEFHNFQQIVYQSQKKLVQDVYVISEIQCVPEQNKTSENNQNLYIKSETEDCIPESSRENVEEEALQYEQLSSLALPKLELMDDLPNDEDVSLLLNSNRSCDGDYVETDICNNQSSTFEEDKKAKLKINDRKIMSLIYDETSSSSANRRILTDTSCKNERNSAGGNDSTSELDEFEEQFSSDDESLLTECDDNNSENAPEDAFKEEMGSLSEATIKDAHKRRSADELDKFIVQWKAMLECVICNGTFPKLTLLQQHFREEHPKDEFYVLCCGSKLRYACRIEDHIAYHIDPSTYSCEMCGRCYKSRLNLMLHNRKYHSSSSFRLMGEKLDKDIDDIIVKWKHDIGCALCSYTHSSLIILRQHFQKKHPQEEFHIACCDRKLKKRRRILEHIRYHVNPNIYKCHSCDNRFDRRADLIMHMRAASHTLNSGRKRYEKEDKEIDDVLAQWTSSVECALCSDTYSSLTLLRQHFQENHRQHTFYYVCCQLKLKERCRILEHIRYHIDPNAFKCNACGRRYKYEKNLILHNKRSHNFISTNENEGDTVEELTKKDLDDLMLQWKQNLKCVICITAFPTYTHLQEHFTVEHPTKQFYVTCCNRKFERVHDVAEHMRYHIDPNVFKCEVCGKRFKYEKNLILHKPSHNLITTNEPVKNAAKKRTQKDLDDLITQWKQHLECIICSSSFPTYTQLREHFTAKHSSKKFYVTCCKSKLERVYDIAEHIRFHMNPNAHKCNICAKLYKHAKSLKTHMQRDHPDAYQNVADVPQDALQGLNNITRKDNITSLKEIRYEYNMFQENEEDPGDSIVLDDNNPDDENNIIRIHKEHSYSNIIPYLEPEEELVTKNSTKEKEITSNSILQYFEQEETWGKKNTRKQKTIKPKFFKCEKIKTIYSKNGRYPRHYSR